MTAHADYTCKRCNRTVELPVKQWQCACGEWMLRVWTPVGIGKGTSGGTPAR